MRRAFTLVELLVVVTIIGIISALALSSGLIGAIQHRQVSEAARILQGSLVGARDAAIRDNAPAGIRLIPDSTLNGINPATGLIDPAFALASSRLIPIAAAPSYNEGLLNQWNGPLPPTVANLAYPGPGTPANPLPTYGQTTVLMVYESVVDPNTGLANEPTSWFWNIRIGDKIQINNAGKWYTVVGPMSITPASGNNEMFVNCGPPGSPPRLTVNGLNPEFLLLINGLDDNQNGYVDEGWDGVDNDGINGADDIGEWLEVESW